MPVLTRSAKELHVLAGEAFALELPETPTTGYRWRLVANALELVTSEFTPSSDAAVGGGGVRRFVLKPPSPGQYRVDAVLCRPWLGDSSRIDEFAATVVAT